MCYSIRYSHHTCTATLCRLSAQPHIPRMSRHASFLSQSPFSVTHQVTNVTSLSLSHTSITNLLTPLVTSPHRHITQHNNSSHWLLTHSHTCSIQVKVSGPSKFSTHLLASISQQPDHPTRCPIAQIPPLLSRITLLTIAPTNSNFSLFL